jgi:NAD-dependent dihydropyrimidine dehydrogenase PreA subunit/flavodoxin
MIFYFSATGNSRYVVDHIKKEGEKIVSIPEAMSRMETQYWVTETRIGIVTPTYFFGMPSIVKEFLEDLMIACPRDAYLFFVATCGTTPGASGQMAEKLMEEKGLTFDAMYSVRMPDTWTPVFDLSDKEAVAEINARADHQIANLGLCLDKEEKGIHLDRRVPLFIGNIAQAFYKNARKTSHFTVSDSCTGCGLCERNCPVHVIEVVNGRPTWTAASCVACLSCLHHCPANAIQYGKKTVGHGQYVHPAG